MKLGRWYYVAGLRNGTLHCISPIGPPSIICFDLCCCSMTFISSIFFQETYTWKSRLYFILIWCLKAVSESTLMVELHNMFAFVCLTFYLEIVFLLMLCYSLHSFTDGWNPIMFMNLLSFASFLVHNIIWFISS